MLTNTSSILVGPKMETNKEKRKDKDSIEENLSSTQGAGSSSNPDKNMGQMASSINRMHLTTVRLSGAARRKLKKLKEGKAQPDTGGFEQPGQVEHNPSTKGKSGTTKRLRPTSETPPAVRQNLKRPRGLSKPGVSFRDVLTATKMAIIKEEYPEAKLDGEEVRDILKEILRKTDGILEGEPLPLLRNFTVQDGVLIYFCDDETTCNWLKANLNGQKLKEGLTLKVMEARDLPKLVKVAFRTKDNETRDPKVLLKRMKMLNPGMKTEHWKVLDKQVDEVGQRLILLVDQDSAKVIKEANMAAYTGLDRGLFKILTNPYKQEKAGGLEMIESTGDDKAPESTEAMETQDDKIE